MYRYTAYELDIASEIELPELVPADGPPTGEPDLRIRLGATPAEIEDPTDQRVTWTVRPGAWLQELNGIARYYVHQDGSEVVIERTGGTDADLRAFLFGTVIGAIFHQRRQFVLHACAVALPAGAVAVAGVGGAGKSTTLAALLGRGHEVLSDDKTVVRFTDDGPEVLSGYPTMRLWHDAAERVGADPSELPRLREGMDKYLYRTPAFRHEPAPLRALVVLGTLKEATKQGESLAAQAVEATRITGHEAIRTVLRQTYRRPILNGSGLQAEHFQWAARLANSVPVVRVSRPRAGDTVQAVADAVEAVVAGATADVEA